MNSRKNICFAALLPFVIGMPLTATAQDAGPYIGGSIGRSHSKIDTAPIAAIGGTVLSKDEDEFGGKVFGGFQIMKYVGMEISYVDLGKFDISGRFGGTPFSANAKVTGIAVSAVGTLPLSSGFDLFAKVGGFFSKTKVNATVAAISATDKSNETDWTFGIGAKYNFNKNLALRVEAERYELGGNDSANLYTFGIQYKF